ncbi:MAG: NADH-quinone oxidoreductase subunit J [Thermoplasmatota archaeon]|nr:NADH-quinone oxidoreductase subunit J [Candidatus Thermoplasmatota archaeon]MBU1914595.1 NADH-quinone oxidoreductase subunit J [Candidatus Thermoplasmatota archaeon]
MTWELFIFLFMAASALISAMMVIASKEIVHSVIALATSFISIAVLFVMLSAEFVAIVQILVYVGAVVVVILFGIMLTRREIMESEKR